MSPEEVVEPDDEGNVARGEASSGVEICLKENSSLVYGGGDLPVPKAGEVGSKKKKLSSSMISVGKKESRTATRG